MNIWIDLTNSPHVNFFAAMIEELRREHEVLLTCRPLANTIEILKLKGFDYHVVGSHYGASKLKKSLGFMVRVLQLVSYLKGHQIDVAISHSSFYSPVVARLMGIRCIYLNDNEHAKGNRISFVCASTIMVPEFFSIDNVRRQWGNPTKVIQYPGVKEGIYLSKLNVGVHAREASEPRVAEIFVRPEPWTAEYYRGATNFINNLIIELKNKYQVTLLPRDERQAEHYRQDKFAGTTIPNEPLSLQAIAARCSLFIGAGGTMTREAAVLGIPTISVYQGNLLAVDRYLIERQYMTHKSTLTVDFVESFLAATPRRQPSSDLLEKGTATSDLIKSVLLNNHSNQTPE